MTPQNPFTASSTNLKKGRDFSIAGGQTIYKATMVSKGINLLAQTATFNKDTRELRQKFIEIKMWEHFNIFSHRAHREQRKL